MRTTQLTAGAVALLALTLGACSADDPGEPGMLPTASTTAAPTDSASPSESSEPTVTPASGPVLDTGRATVNLPTGWKDNRNGLPYTYSGSPRQSGGIRLITVVDVTGASGYTLGERAHDAMNQLAGAKLSRLPNVSLDGAPAYHVAGTAPVRGHYEEVGTMAHGRAISISFSLHDYTAAQRRELINSVIASFQWKD